MQMKRRLWPGEANRCGREGSLGGQEAGAAAAHLVPTKERLQGPAQLPWLAAEGHQAAARSLSPERRGRLRCAPGGRRRSDGHRRPGPQGRRARQRGERPRGLRAACAAGRATQWLAAGRSLGAVEGPRGTSCSGAHHLWATRSSSQPWSETPWRLAASRCVA